MNKIRVIGDIHGKFNEYFNLIHNADYSIQLGDCGFDYSQLSKIDSKRHVFIKGNHDNHDIDDPHNIGKYGLYSLNGITFFFVSGGFSIDYRWRQQEELLGRGRSWWPNEELSYEEMCDCLALYASEQPDFVISHEQPTVMVDKVGTKGMLTRFGFSEDWKSNTQQLLQNMYESFKPALWIAGHFHRRMIWKEGKTQFVSLEELGYVDIDENLKVISKCAN